MKKISLVSLVSFVFLSFSSIVAYFLRYLVLNKWVMLSIGFAIVIVSGILSVIFNNKKLIKYISLILNALALGICIRTWYIFREYDNSLALMLLVSIACVCYLWMFYLMLYIPYFDKYCDLFLMIFIVISLIGYIVLIILTKTSWLSTFGYYMIVEIAFIIGLCLATESFDELIKVMLICSYSIFIVAIIIMIFMLAGDGLDFDFDFSFGDIGNISSPKNKRLNNNSIY